MRTVTKALWVFVLGSAAASTAVALYAQSRKGLTAAQAKEIRDLFVGDDAASYRLTLPVIEGGKVTRTEVYGALPLDRVRQIATRKSVPLRADAQVHAVIIHAGSGGDSGKGGSGGSGGQGGTGGVSGTAGGSMQTTPTNKIERLKQILRGLDQTRYQLLVEEAKAGK